VARDTRAEGEGFEPPGLSSKAFQERAEPLLGYAYNVLTRTSVIGRRLEVAAFGPVWQKFMAQIMARIALELTESQTVSGACTILYWPFWKYMS
jgi:hypothetical protein